MKKFMTYSWIAIGTIMETIGYPLANDIVLTMDVPQKQDIYNKFVAQTGLQKTAPDNYHVTVGWIKNVDPRDKIALSQYMKNKLATYNNFPFTFSHADRYLVGNRTPNKCPLVLFPDQKSKQQFEAINFNLSNFLYNFQSVSGKKYTFFDDVKPGTYTPHFTLANTHHIATHAIDRNAVISEINVKLAKYKKAHRAPYKTTLQAATKKNHQPLNKKVLAKKKAVVAKKAAMLAKKKAVAAKKAQHKAAKKAAIAKKKQHKKR